MPEKTILRKELRARRMRLFSSPEGGLRSRLMQERLLASPQWQACRRVAAYVSVNSEAGTELIVAEALRSGRELFLPRCRVQGEEGWPGGMDFIACRSVESLHRSGFGIPEPLLSSDSRLLSVEEMQLPDTLILVPGLAFDRRGFRLGYGGGYYDRMLAQASCPCIGLTFHELLLPYLPCEEWDRPVPAVCTEEELLCI